MPDIAEIIRSGAANPWIYLPAALLLGALHALEPGHSKSMMAAFIVTVRGTPWQAVVLGICAAVGHTLIIFVLAVVGLSLGDQLILDKAEPWLILASGLLIVIIALRIFVRIAWPREASHRDHHDHTHGHDHADDHEHDHPHHDDHHDTHAAEHAADVARRLSGRPVTTADIAWFGFTAGLLPCPAAFAVLLVCLQLKAFTLGVAMIAAFSVGLAITLVAVGVAAAWGASAASKKLPGFDAWAHRLPYASAAIVLLIGTLISLQGLMRLAST